MFYETKHPIQSDYFKIESGENYNFPPHIHRHFELITVLDGTLCVTVDKKNYRICENDALLIFPNQIHSLKSEENNRHILCIFSPELIKAFSKSVAGKLPLDNKFPLNSFYKAKLTDADFDTLSAKGFLYSVCAEFSKFAEYNTESTVSNSLLNRIFNYVDKNFKSECSLFDLANDISYDYAYLSKYFKKTVGISFCDYVNAYRLGEACYLLKNSSSSITDIALECGFLSIRSFNRNFKSNFGLTPSQYRKK